LPGNALGVRPHETPAADPEVEPGAVDLLDALEREGHATDRVGVRHHRPDRYGVTRRPAKAAIRSYGPAPGGAGC
jgi:hypothetical protein